MSYTFHVSDQDTGLPVEGALCSIKDRTGTANILSRRKTLIKRPRLVEAMEGAGGYTDANGEVTIVVLFPPRYYDIGKAGYDLIIDEPVPGTDIVVALVPSSEEILHYLNIYAGVGGSVSIDGGPPVSSVNLRVPSGTVVMVEAIPDVNLTFSYWLVNDVNAGTTNPKSFTINQNTSIIAIFLAVQHTVTVQSGAGGMVIADGYSAYPGIPAQFSVDEGSTLNLDAIPDSGKFFDYWTIEGIRSSLPDPVRIVINRDYAIAAIFVGEEPPPEPPPGNGNGEENGKLEGLIKKDIVVYDSHLLKTEAWETGKRDTKEVKVYTGALERSELLYTIHFVRGNDPFGVMNRIRLNDEIIVEERIAWNETVTGKVIITGKLEGKNTLEIWHGSDALTWAEVSFDVTLRLYYSETPPTDCLFPILPRFGPLKDAPVLCSIWDALAGVGILRSGR